MNVAHGDVVVQISAGDIHYWVCWRKNGDLSIVKLKFEYHHDSDPELAYSRYVEDEETRIPSAVAELIRMGKPKSEVW